MMKLWRFVPVWMAVFVLGGSLALVAQRGGQGGGPQGRGGFGGRGGGPAVPNTAMYRVTGARDGASIFPKTNYWQTRPLVAGAFDIKHYHTPEEALSLLRTWAQKYPDLVDLYSVGKSFEGRDIWQITITNKKNGKDTDKPAFFIEGGRHSGEVTGTETVLYFINHVLTSYGTDPAITKLVDTKALYCKPNNNPDGNSLYLLTAQSNRSTVRPYDDDGDGLLDEDPPEDLNGDGFITQMRQLVGAGKGNAKKDPRDPKGRLMMRVPQGEGDYVLMSEGIDNDNDGRINEDGIGGLDLHRNYPENWRPMSEATGRGYAQGGSGEYPLSETETRAVFLFLMAHPNVAAAQTLDTSVPMILRGPSTERDEVAMTPDDLALHKAWDKKGLEITGYPWAGDTYYVYSNRSRGGGERGGAAPAAGAPAAGGRGGAASGRGSQAAPAEERGGSPIFGHSPDFGYSYFGVPWYGDEIWNGGNVGDYDKDGKIDEWDRLKYCDDNRAGKGDFIDWKPFRHPTLGEVEIGGWNPKFWSQNPPPDLLETWARNEAMWNLWMAEQLPQVKILSAVATPAKAAPAKGQRTAPVIEGEYDLTVTVTNEGLMPTALDIAKRVKIVRPDSLGLALSGATLAPAAEGQPPQRPTQEIGWLKAGEKKTVTWRVKGAGKATVNLSSTRGGIDSMEVAIAPAR